ncbi:MAG: hypothetical protein K0S45_4327, partial [Nitrospira sp.]|nr:hypothetical protein [Nitrospira sp.]
MINEEPAGSEPAGSGCDISDYLVFAISDPLRLVQFSL